MLITQIILLFNEFVLYLFGFIYVYFNIETIEDRFHKDKKNEIGKHVMNKVKFEFARKEEFDIVKKNILNILQSSDVCKKYNISMDRILNNNDNHKLAIIFNDNDNCIYVYFNHYYISGPNMFVLLNKIVNSEPPPFLQTNPFWGIVCMPFYIYDLIRLQELHEKKEYTKTENQIQHFMVEQNIHVKNKRCYLYLNILRKVYTSLQLNRPMVVALSIAFDDLPYIKNNVGLIIVKYEPEDTIETFDAKLKGSYYQAYCSNFIVNCPLPMIGNRELRDYVDCIVSSMYIKSDFDFKLAWNCIKPPIEQMYVGSVSILHSDDTMDINMCMTTRSSNYRNLEQDIVVDDFFE